MRLWLPALVLVLGCDELVASDGGGGRKDGAPSTAATAPGGGTGGSDVFTDIPCGQILDCNSLCDPATGDVEACWDSCYDAAYPRGRDLFDALDDCVGAAGCEDWWCVEDSCAGPLEACEEDIPPGGWGCYAEGWYEVCEGGACTDYMAPGAAWGASREAAEFWAVFDCTEHMTNMIIVWSATAVAGAQVMCEATACESY